MYLYITLSLRLLVNSCDLYVLFFLVFFMLLSWFQGVYVVILLGICLHILILLEKYGFERDTSESHTRMFFGEEK